MGSGSSRTSPFQNCPMETPVPLTLWWRLAVPVLVCAVHHHDQPSLSFANFSRLLLVTGTFLNTLKFIVKDCDPNTGEPDEDQGFKDEYVVSRHILRCSVD